MAPKGMVARRAARMSCTTKKPRKKAGCCDEGHPFDAVIVPFDHGNSKEKDEVTTTTDGCSTPKAERFKIPAIGTCPPAPKKRKPRCRLRRRRAKTRSYFASPDIEKFFLHALGGISV